jgi:phospholipid transport system substrate-binding protein
VPRVPPFLALRLAPGAICLGALVGGPTLASAPSGAHVDGAAPDDCRSAPKAPLDPLAELRRSDRELASALKRRVPDWSPEAEANAARIERLLAALLDYEAIAREALGPHWDALTPDQRSRFLALFSPLTNRALVAAAERNVSVSYDSETISGPEATVVVTPRGAGGAGESLARVEYKLRGHCGRWRIHDVVIDGESLVESYRAQLDQLFRRGTFEDLLVVMRRKLHRTVQ